MSPITSCVFCKDPLPQEFIHRKLGRPRKWCAKLECCRLWKRKTQKTYQDRLRAGLVIPRKNHDEYAPREPPIPPKPLSWWLAQALSVEGACPKCAEPVEGVYVSPTQATMGECAVVAHCRCGWERMVVAGRGGMPYENGSESA